MSKDTPTQPKLADLLAGYLGRQAEAPANLDGEGEVVAYDAGPVHPVDPGLAWNETLVVARCFAPGLKPAEWPAPAGWSALVAAHEPVVALACALGNFPQMVRHFHTILQCRNLALLRPGSGSARPVHAPGLVEWARKSAEKGPDGRLPHLLAALGTLRAVREFDEAERLFQAHDAQIAAADRTAWENERAALAWHRGQSQQACDIWHRLEPTGVTLFNRGMADLFLDRPTQAHHSLKAAVARLPEEGAWGHLARLYLTLG